MTVSLRLRQEREKIIREAESKTHNVQEVSSKGISDKAKNIGFFAGEVGVGIRYLKAPEPNKLCVTHKPKV